MPGEPQRTLLHSGGVANAVVWLCRESGGAEWVEKDFSGAPWLVRHTLGRFLIAREAWVLGRLAATGVVPGGVRRVSPLRLREEVVPGFALRDSACGVYRGNEPDPAKVRGADPAMISERPPASFFDALENGVRACHAAGFVHLDLHNARNVMVAPGFRPVMLDWQSALPTRWLPRPLRRALESIDLAGVEKFRAKFRPEEMTDERRRRLERQRFVRRHFWVPRIRLGGRGPSSGSATKESRPEA